MCICIPYLQSLGLAVHVCSKGVTCFTSEMCLTDNLPWLSHTSTLGISQSLGDSVVLVSRSELFPCMISHKDCISYAQVGLGNVPLHLISYVALPSFEQIVCCDLVELLHNCSILSSPFTSPRYLHLGLTSLAKCVAMSHPNIRKNAGSLECSFGNQL